MKTLCLSLSILFWLPCLAVAQTHVGSAACAGCHQAEYDNWRQSDHFLAMAEATPDTVLGDFDEASFEHFGTITRFRTRDGRYFVETGNADGETEEFAIAYTFGHFPLQQYLIEMPDGRLQALSVTWDSRPASEGGQRWYHLYPDEAIDADDPLHWTGAFQNWNSRCASCHSTDLQKHYDQPTDSYATTWSEINVACEACHGPGSEHLTWAESDMKTPNHGLVTDLQKAWEPIAGQLPIPEHDDVALGGQLQVCAGCHSRRGELQQRDPAESYFDNYSLSPLLSGLYWPDGQVREEVYVAGSFLQSKMHANQVSCTNCHEAHTGQLLVEGNGLCLQCHAARDFETDNHYFHPPGSEGAQCVNCHMPATTYMGVDARRDHSFRIPDPIAAGQFDVPDTCTGCHSDQDATWAAGFLSARTGRNEPVYAHTALLANARAGDASTAPELRAYAANGMNPAILRNIILIESARFPSLEHMSAVYAGLNDADPLIRLGAVAASITLDVGAQLEYLRPLMSDPVKSVRMAVARTLGNIPANQLPAGQRQAFNTLLDEYEASLLFNADMPESMSDLGALRAAQGDLAGAQAALLQAHTLAPGFLPGLLNLSDVYRAQGRDDLGERLLNEGLGMYPDSADVNYALGLLYVRTGRTPNAVFLFQRAARLAPDNPQYVLVHAVSLAETGRVTEAIGILEEASTRFPGNGQISNALQAYRGLRQP